MGRGVVVSKFVVVDSAGAEAALNAQVATALRLRSDAVKEALYKDPLGEGRFVQQIGDRLLKFTRSFDQVWTRAEHKERALAKNELVAQMISEDSCSSGGLYCTATHKDGKEFHGWFCYPAVSALCQSNNFVGKRGCICTKLLEKLQRQSTRLPSRNIQILVERFDMLLARCQHASPRSGYPSSPPNVNQ